MQQKQTNLATRSQSMENLRSKYLKQVLVDLHTVGGHEYNSQSSLHYSVSQGTMHINKD